MPSVSMPALTKRAGGLFPGVLLQGTSHGVSTLMVPLLNIERQAFGDVGWTELEKTAQVALRGFWDHELLNIALSLFGRPGGKVNTK